MSGGGGVDIRSAQEMAWANKLAKGFSTTDVPLEFCLLTGEVAESFDAWRKGRGDLAEELADTAIYLLGLAQMTGPEASSHNSRSSTEVGPGADGDSA